MNDTDPGRFEDVLKSLIRSGVREIEIETDDGEVFVHPITGSTSVAVARYSGVSSIAQIDKVLIMLKRERSLVVDGVDHRLHVTAPEGLSEDSWLIRVKDGRTRPSSRTADPRHASCGAGAAPRVADAHG